MKSIARFENSRANVNDPVYPAILFSDDNDVVDYVPSLPVAAYSCVFLVMVQNADAAMAVTNARSYAKAIASMIRNCPVATVSANAGVTANLTVLERIEIGFDQIKTNDAGTDFMQQFDIRVVYQLEGSGV
jgi:hypothetical protein